MFLRFQTEGCCSQQRPSLLNFPSLFLLTKSLRNYLYFVPLFTISFVFKENILNISFVCCSAQQKSKRTFLEVFTLNICLHVCNVFVYVWNQFPISENTPKNLIFGSDFSSSHDRIQHPTMDTLGLYSFDPLHKFIWKQTQIFNFGSDFSSLHDKYSMKYMTVCLIA